MRAFQVTYEELQNNVVVLNQCAVTLSEGENLVVGEFFVFFATGIVEISWGKRTPYHVDCCLISKRLIMENGIPMAYNLTFRVLDILAF